jgi:hypothetical protein
MACVAAAALALAACSKNEESPVATAATADNTRTVVYSVGGDEGRTTLKDDAEWDAMLERFCTMAAEGQTVTFYSLGRPQRHSAASKAESKEDQHFSTDDREEMKAWMKAREKEGLTVSVSYDEQSGRWSGVARETTAMRQDLTECYTGTMTCVDMPWEDDMIVGATVPALVLADSTVLILVHDDYTLVCGMPLDGYGDEEFEAWIEKNAEELAKKDAAEQGTIFEELLGIDYETETYDDDAAFDDEYDNYLEFEWECRTGR